MWRSKDQHSVSGESGVIHFNLFLSLTGILANIPRLTRTHKQNKLFCLFKQCNICSSYHFAISTDAKMNFTFVRTHLRSTLLWIVVIFRHYWRDFFPSLPWFLGVFISSASILCIKVFVLCSTTTRDFSYFILLLRFLFTSTKSTAVRLAAWSLVRLASARYTHIHSPILSLHCTSKLPFDLAPLTVVVRCGTWGCFQSKNFLYANRKHNNWKMNSENGHNAGN